MKAIKDRIIVELKKSNSPILMTDSPKYCNCGTVIGVGESVKDILLGDEIVFHVFDEIPLPENDWVIIREKSVLAILDNCNT